jgi:hypothetical protein
MGLMSEEKLRSWRNAIFRDHKSTGVTLGEMLHALIDNSLQALKIDRSRELDWREQQIREGLTYLRGVAMPDPGDYWQSVDPDKVKFTIDMLDEMLAAKPGTPRWFIAWASMRERIAEEYGDDETPPGVVQGDAAFAGKIHQESEWKKSHD